ncbi:uncharacterized protein LOC129592755 [Paramacrobiotus metropolitanus]|uniref:uncharacterized protein LOC129592755 n=1 Tax=Paramacrobiotus metropolitanus TaxID=2943436 RepID=UPI002446244D|nr:uncharacterized protein LOC129592755 [Paramacrobiotus metropolitanus]
MSSYQNIAQDYLFRAVGVETVGPLGPEASRLISELGKMIWQETGEIRLPASATNCSAPTAEQQQRIAALHAAGCAVAEIVRKVGTSLHYVRCEIELLSGRNHHQCPNPAHSVGCNDQERQIVRLFDEGRGVSEIAHRLRLNPATVYRKLRLLGKTTIRYSKRKLSGEKPHESASPLRDNRQSPEMPEPTAALPTRRPILNSCCRATRCTTRITVTHKQQQTIRELFDKGYSASHIVRRVGLGQRVIEQELLRMGKCPSDNGVGGHHQRYHPRTAEARSKILQLFDQNVSQEEICRRVKLNHQTIAKVVRLAGRSFTDRRWTKYKDRRKPQKSGHRADSRQSRPKSRSLARTTVQEHSDSDEFEDAENAEEEASQPVAIQCSEAITSDATAKPLEIAPETNRRPVTDAAKADNGVKEAETAVIGCHGPVGDSRYRCQACGFQTAAETAFLSHLMSPSHKRHTDNFLLACADCQFRSRQPSKMLQHCIKHAN